MVARTLGDPPGETTTWLTRLGRDARFLNAIEAEAPVGKIMHVILDNYAAYKHPKVRAWLGRHPRYVFRFTPSSASWLNAVEGFFAKLSKRRLQRGVFHSIVDLRTAINRFLAEANNNPKPFVWTADPDQRSSPPSSAGTNRRRPLRSS